MSIFTHKNMFSICVMSFELQGKEDKLTIMSTSRTMLLIPELAAAK